MRGPFGPSGTEADVINGMWSNAVSRASIVVLERGGWAPDRITVIEERR